MASKKNSFALVGKHMQRRPHEGAMRAGAGEMPAIADLIRRIDVALLTRRAA